MSEKVSAQIRQRTNASASTKQSAAVLYQCLFTAGWLGAPSGWPVNSPSKVGCRSMGSQVDPLALRSLTQMSTDFLESDFTSVDRNQWRRICSGAAVKSVQKRVNLPCGSPSEVHDANRLGGKSGVIPNGGLRNQLDNSRPPYSAPSSQLAKPVASLARVWGWAGACQLWGRPVCW